MNYTDIAMNHKEFINYNDTLYNCALSFRAPMYDIDRARSIYFDRAFNPININEPRAYMQIISDTARAWRKIFMNIAYCEGNKYAHEIADYMDELFMDMYQEQLNKL
jgi:hypothetical protein